MPLSHPPGHAQCDFGEALVIICGVEQKAHCFVLDLPHSDGCFVKAYPAETTEAFLDGHVSAFAFLGGAPRSILYDNTKLAVARILGDGRRKRTRAFTELQSHYLFDDRFGRPGKGNDKGKVEGMVGYTRRNFLAPVPSFASFEALNAHLERRCLARMDARLRGHSESIGQRMERDLEAIDGRTAHRLFMTIAQFPAMRVSWLREIVGGSAGEVSRHLGRFVETGLVAVFDGRHYLLELGMKRAANMSRVLPAVIRSRHGAYLDRWYREHEQHHNDGVNRLVARFAREGVEVAAGWRGEVNVPGLTQVRPDLLVQVSGGALGTGAYYIEFERRAVSPQEVEHKLGPYRRMAAAGRALPLLMVCETARGRRNFRAAARRLPMLTATLERALAGPVTGAVTVWSRDGVPAALHCR